MTRSRRRRREADDRRQEGELEDPAWEPRGCSSHPVPVYSRRRGRVLPSHADDDDDEDGDDDDDGDGDGDDDGGCDDESDDADDDDDDDDDFFAADEAPPLSVSVQSEATLCGAAVGSTSMTAWMTNNWAELH